MALLPRRPGLSCLGPRRFTNGAVGWVPSSANPDLDETPSDHSRPRSSSPCHCTRPRRVCSAADPKKGVVPTLIFPVAGRRDLHRRLRPGARRRRPSGQRPDGREEDAGRRGRERQGQVLDDVRERRLHALSLRRQRDDVRVHPPEQRPDDEERQPRLVRRGRVVREGLEVRRARAGRPDDRLPRRLGRRERDRVAPALRGASERRRGSVSVSVPAVRAAPAVLREGRHAVHTRTHRQGRHSDRHGDDACRSRCCRASR